MEAVLTGLLGNIFLWILLASLFGGYFTLRLSNNYRDQAAFVDFPDSPDRYILRARVASVFFFLFLAVILVSLTLVVFELLQVTRPQDISLVVQPDPTASATAPPTATTTSQQRVFLTATPRPTALPSTTPAPTGEVMGIARIGNTNFQGVNVRAIPTLQGDIVARLVNRTEVEVLSGEPVIADGFTWRQVRLDDGQVGWVVEKYLVIRSTPSDR